MADNDWSKFQAFLSRNDFFYSFVCLPVARTHDPSYISASKLLDEYHTHMPLIMAFAINKSCDEYCVLVPRSASLDDSKQLLTHFVGNPDVWTSKPFVEQDAQYICHPKIWFYENLSPRLE